MKIRTGFVTNSSSYSSAVIRIQSKELADLLKKYKKPLFPKREKGLYSGRIQGVSFRGDLISVNEESDADAWECPPESIDNFIETPLYALGRQWEQQMGSAPPDDFGQLHAEMRNRKKELTDSIQKVEWVFEDDSYGEFKNRGRRTFSYNRNDQKK